MSKSEHEQPAPDDRGKSHDGCDCDCGHDHETAGTPDAAHTPGCACCTGGDDSAESLAIIEEDPALRSLNKALTASFAALKLLMMGMVALFLITRVTFIEQGEIGLKRQFGAYVKDAVGAIRVYEPGSLVFVWPEPIETLETLPQSRVMTLKVATEFWPQLPADAAIKNENLPEAPTLAPGKDGYAITGDQNILHSRWTVNYRIADFERYLLQSREPVAVLRQAVLSSVLQCLAGVSVDDAYYRRTGELFDAINRAARQALTDRDGLPVCGLELISITSDDIRPPGKTQNAFSAVIGALSEKTRLIEEARKFADITEVEARGEADRIRKEAEAEARLTASRAKGDSQRLQDLLARFPNDPQGLNLYLRQYRYDQLKEILARSNRYFLPPGKSWFMMSPSPQDYMNEDGAEQKK